MKPLHPNYSALSVDERKLYFTCHLWSGTIMGSAEINPFHEDEFMVPFFRDFQIVRAKKIRYSIYSGFGFPLWESTKPTVRTTNLPDGIEIVMIYTPKTL